MYTSKFSVVLELLFLIKTVKNDWVEIPQMYPEAISHSVTYSTNLQESSNFNAPVVGGVLKTHLKLNSNRSVDNLYSSKIERKNFESFEEIDENVNFKESEDHGFGYSGFIPLIQTIQSTLVKNSHKGLKGKVNFLKSLRDHLLYNINQKVNSLWGRNEDRAARDYKDNHLDFPSNEGALMTIGFLTFAVFLIKLVLKLITAYKNNNNSNTISYIGRKKRSELGVNDIEILKLIEEYKFQ